MTGLSTLKVYPLGFRFMHFCKILNAIFVKAECGIEQEGHSMQALGYSSKVQIIMRIHTEIMEKRETLVFSCLQPFVS